MAAPAGKLDPALRIRELEKALKDSQQSIGKLLDAANEKSEQLGIVNGLLRSLGTALDLREILQVFAINIKRICPYDRISIALYDAGTRRFTVPFQVKGGRVMPSTERPVAYEDTIQSKVLETRTPILRRNVKEESLRFKHDTNFLKKGFACELLFPLVLGPHELGTFNVGCFEPETLTERHQQILADIIPCVVIAVDRYLGRPTQDSVTDYR
ncbi:MAG: GAF domain-containing protein [Planctomycetes bacterium]|nr:GAF domain-containing protein [Planctomycetota bacterium]